jgi:hypothetical protein
MRSEAVYLQSTMLYTLGLLRTGGIGWAMCLSTGAAWGYNVPSPPAPSQDSLHHVYGTALCMYVMPIHPVLGARHPRILSPDLVDRGAGF